MPEEKCAPVNPLGPDPISHNPNPSPHQLGSLRTRCAAAEAGLEMAMRRVEDAKVQMEKEARERAKEKWTLNEQVGLLTGESWGVEWRLGVSPGSRTPSDLGAERGQRASGAQ